MDFFLFKTEKKRPQILHFCRVRRQEEKKPEKSPVHYIFFFDYSMFPCLFPSFLSFNIVAVSRKRKKAREGNLVDQKRIDDDDDDPLRSAERSTRCTAFRSSARSRPSRGCRSSARSRQSTRCRSSARSRRCTKYRCPGERRPSRGCLREICQHVIYVCVCLGWGSWRGRAVLGLRTVALQSAGRVKSSVAHVEF